MDEIYPRVKLSLTCSFCSKILNFPIELPCGDLICQEHLEDKEIIKQIHQAKEKTAVAVAAKVTENREVRDKINKDLEEMAKRMKDERDAE